MLGWELIFQIFVECFYNVWAGWMTFCPRYGEDEEIIWVDNEERTNINIVRVWSFALLVWSYDILIVVVYCDIVLYKVANYTECRGNCEWVQCWKHKQSRIIIAESSGDLQYFRDLWELMSSSRSYVGGRAWAGLQGASPTCHITADPHCFTTASQHQQLCKSRERV